MRRLEEEDVFSMSFTDVLTCVLVSSIFLFLIFVALVRSESASSLMDGMNARAAGPSGQEAIALGQAGNIPIVVRLTGDAPLDERGWIAPDKSELKNLNVESSRSGIARAGSELFMPSWQNQLLGYRLLTNAVRSDPYDAWVAVWIGGNCFEVKLKVPGEATFNRLAEAHAIGRSIELFSVRMQGEFPVKTAYAIPGSERVCR